MARLLVKLHGEEVSKITLESGVEYIVGRATDAHIHLKSERGISRHHLKLYGRDGIWVCESLSKFGLLQKGGVSLEVIELDEPCLFTVPPYEFYFEPTQETKEADPEPVKPSENLPALTTSEHTAPRANNEATMAGMAATLVPYFRISYPNTADDEVLKLEGNLWVAGRDHDCELRIDSPHVSRKHFELARTKEGFFVTDLGSSNGTKINGQRIPPHEPTRIESGDELQVKNVEMAFEIRDVGFNQRLDRLPVSTFDPMLASPAQWQPQPQEAQALTELRPRSGEPFPKKLKDIRWHHIKALGPKKLIVRGSLVLAVPIVLILAMTPDKPKPSPGRDPASPGNTSVTFEKLTNEQRSVVKDSFNLARNLYVQGKYELCLTELSKLHELIPQYENSMELKSFCEQGRELVKRQRDLERKERERALIEQQISGYVENCKTKLKDEGTVEDTRQCLAEAMELDPEHHLIVEMIHTAQMHEEEQKVLSAQKAEIDKKAKRGQAHYARAQELYKKGQLTKAIAEYERLIATAYPRSTDLKNNARRDLASIKKERQSKVDTLVNDCKSQGGQGHFKDAYIACDKAVEEDPTNSATKEMRAQMMSELKREMKGIYEDSVLEESLGNVDSAKEKWKKIIKEDVNGGEYALKAKSKLQKYGIGM